MLWILIALLSPLLHGLSNILDNYFVNGIFRNPVILVFFASSINILFLPLILLIETPHMLPLNVLPFIIILGLTNIFYLYPYYKALESDDTSIVSSLFSLGKIFVPLLAFFIVQEKLTTLQYAGFFVILLASTALTLNTHQKKIRLNNSFFWMLLCSLILTIESVMYKYVFIHVSWATGFFWAVISSFVLVLPMLCIKKYRRDIVSQFSTFKKSFHLFALEEFLTFGGSIGSTLAISLAPVTLVEGIFSLQPVFVLGYALLFSRWYPKVFKEKIDAKSIIKKVFLFLILLTGVLLLTR